ncbi:unnamed protein product [Urochloa humidicola]
MSAAAGFPKWVLLEPFVFRRDDEDSFPDETKAPIRASGTTSLEAPFNVAFSLAEPPLISRLYAQLPGFPDPKKEVPLAILATHRNLALLRVATSVSEGFRQDFFIYDSASGDKNRCSLKALPVPSRKWIILILVLLLPMAMKEREPQPSSACWQSNPWASCAVANKISSRWRS